MVRSNMNLLFKDKSACLRLTSPPALTSTSHCNSACLCSAHHSPDNYVVSPRSNVEARERELTTQSKLSPNKQCSVRAQSALNIIPVCLSAFSVYQVLCISHLKTWETCNNRIFSSFLFLNPLLMISPPKSSINLWA